MWEQLSQGSIDGILEGSMLAREKIPTGEVKYITSHTSIFTKTKIRIRLFIDTLIRCMV